ncbi:uncharacterized protein N7484_003155 [Penicillium longicatenatum]|uniref:uncharacterized protein n=1 Tax=Penicillium longicatenatum TaxID=1561947 RepID=UPI0025477EF5|nr:uncharacterized protein N7484_003155 [Penicillium longicatenatum]KAJ5649432.1 hypothetical protein N7484_003155 [Penicillium longicatenatum]
MVGILILVGFAAPSFAYANSTALEGWQFDDDSRSSWDIFWTCLSTILACTWTALHLAVPSRESNESWQIFRKLQVWICAILAPELMAGLAAEGLCRAMAVVARCNAAFCRLSDEPTESISRPLETSVANEQISGREKTSHQENEDPSTRPKEGSTREEEVSKQEEQAPSEDKTKTRTFWWSTAQGFCLTMNGVLLQTKDDWTYPVQPNNVVPLIEAGVVKPFHLRTRDIKDRAKADSLAKGFTLLQSLWVTCNIVARRAYSLPISPLEYSTVAYVVCAAVTYVTWWHKPRDMVTPILIFLPYDKDDKDMPLQIRKALDEGHGSWVRSSETAVEDSLSLLENLLQLLKIARKLLSLPFTPKGRNILAKSVETATKDLEDAKETLPSNDPPRSCRRQYEENARPSYPADEPQKPTNKIRNPLEQLSLASYVTLTNLYMFVALTFCGIHVAAWNSQYPTKAEQICWRVFSLSAFCVVWPIYLIHIWMFYRMYRATGNKRALVSDYDMVSGRLIALWSIWFCIYSIARWGNLILMFLSLRALPAGSYVTIDWMSTIPHI